MELVTRCRLAMMLLGSLLCALPCAASAAGGGSQAFNEGMRLMAKGDYDGACKAFARSEDPTPTMASRYQLGRCNEERHHYGTAYWAFIHAARLAEQAGDSKRAGVAHQRAREVEAEAHATRLVVVIKPEQQIAGLSIKQDDEELPRETWGKALPADAGKHTIELSAPGMESKRFEVTVLAGPRPTMIEVPALSPVGSGATTAPTGTGNAEGAAGTEGTAPPPPPPPPDSGPKMVRRSNGAFWTGMGLIIAGGLSAVGGGAVWANQNVDQPLPTAIGLWIGAAALIGVGIPLMVVFGKKVPAEPQQVRLTGPTLSLELVAQPTGGGLRLQF